MRRVQITLTPVVEKAGAFGDEKSAGKPYTVTGFRSHIRAAAPEDGGVAANVVVRFPLSSAPQINGSWGLAMEGKPYQIQSVVEPTAGGGQMVRVECRQRSG